MHRAGLILVLSGEVFPAAGLSGVRRPAESSNEMPAAAHEASDAGDADSGERARNSRRRRSCEEELVVLAAVEGEIEGAGGCGSRATRLRGVGLLRQGMNRASGGGGDFGANAGFAAEVARDRWRGRRFEIDAGPGGKTNAAAEPDLPQGAAEGTSGDAR